MANTSGSTTPAPNKTINVPRLQVQVNNYLSQSPITNLTHGHPSIDPTADGLFDWTNPGLTLFTRDMTPEVLELNPVIVLERYIPRARNSVKNGVKNRSVKRWVIPGNSANNGLNFHGGSSNTDRGGASFPEVSNFIPITNTAVGYNQVIHDTYELPVSRFVRPSGGLYGSVMTQAFYSQDWNNSVVYSRHRPRRNYYLKFRVSLAIPNPNWTDTNHQNKWIFGDGQTIIVEPRLQTFNDGSGNLEYYVAWLTKVVN